jgi:hypothetical protein
VEQGAGSVASGEEVMVYGMPLNAWGMSFQSSWFPELTVHVLVMAFQCFHLAERADIKQTDDAVSPGSGYKMSTGVPFAGVDVRAV